MTPAQKKATEIVGSCTCHEGYTSRKLRDPSCAWCEHGAAVAEVIEERDKIKARYDRLLSAAKPAANFLHDLFLPYVTENSKIAGNLSSAIKEIEPEWKIDAFGEAEEVKR